LCDVKTKTESLRKAGPGNDCGRILVLGLGNLLLKDEGVGVHVVQQLQHRSLGENVEVVDGGTAGLDLLLLEQGLEKVVIIDAVRGGRSSGTIYKTRFRAKEIHNWVQALRQEEGGRISLHQVGLIDALVAAEKVGTAPDEIVIIGVEPEQIDCGLELTEIVEQKIPQIIDAVLEELKDAVHTR
jgi:hydrogenase maturation protease